MTNVQEIYLSLLQQAIGFAAIDDAQCTMHGEVSLNANRSTLDATAWQQLLRLAQIQGTAPLIFNELLSLPFEGKENERIGSVMKQVCMQNMMGYEKHIHLLQQVWNALTEHHLHPVLLKGFGLARLYPHPYLRSWGDLDIYVGLEQYHQAAAALRAAFPDAKHHEEEWEELKHYNFILPNGNVIEMHRSTIKLELPRDKRVYYALEHAGCVIESREERIENRVTVTIPETKFNMLFTFMHAWYHFVEEGVGFKQICDVALLAHHTYNQQSAISNQQSFAKYLHRNLRKLHLMQPWQLIGYVIVHALYLNPQEWPLYNENAWLRKHGPIFMQRILEEGIARPKDFGDSKDRYEAREKAKRMNVIARKWMTLKSRFRGAMMIWSYSPQYTRHMMAETLYKGLRRIIEREKMEVMY